MRKAIIFLSAIALSATTLSFADVAFAQPGKASAREPMTRTDAESRANDAFARLDANGDGLLSKADRETGIAEYFAKADTDGNGQLSLAEATAAHEARRTERRERFVERRAERPRGDRKRGEARMGGRRDARGLRSLVGIVRSADADGDRQISQSEFSAAALARFDRADADGDGAITREDRKALREAFRAKRTRSGEAGE